MLHDREEYIRYQKVLALRGYAALCDYASYFCICFLYFLIVSKRIEGLLWTAPLFPHVFVFIILWLFWFPWLESRDGKTVFKAIFKIRVVHTDGTKVTFDFTLMRHVLDPVDLFLFLGLVAAISSTITKNHQRLGDMLAYTMVVRSDQKNSLEPVKKEHAGEGTD